MKAKMKLVHRDTLSCEPILRRVGNGELLLVSQCGDVKEPAPGNRVVVFHSADEGESWSPPVLIRPEDGKAVYLTEVSVIGNRVITYITTHNGHFLDWRCDRLESVDNGYTWRSIGPLEGFSAFTFPRGMIRLRDGALMLACQHYPISEEENKRLISENADVWDARIDRVENHVLISRDEGMTWESHRGPDIAIKGDTGRKWVWSEPTLIELKDGRIVMLLRVCGSGRLYRSDSADGGRTFCAAYPTDIPNPNNKPKLLRMNDGRIALIHTPNGKLGFAGRNPLSLWLSADELESFSEQYVITDFPGVFCYPDGFSEGTHVVFSIEYNRHDILYIDVDTQWGGRA